MLSAMFLPDLLLAAAPAHAQINLSPITFPRVRLQRAEPNTLLQKTQDATVHILCSATTPKGIRSVSGTGVMIDPRGIIISNAHIMSQLAAPDTTATCVARTGNPSANPTPLTLIYISPKWLAEYGPQIYQDELAGTGENDFALAYLQPKPNTPPQHHVFIPSERIGQFTPGDTVLGCAYPAEFISADSITSRLYQNCSYINTGKGFTFAKDTFDAISLGGTILARAGVSGGPIVDQFGVLQGIMATSSRENSTSARTLTAITFEHILRSFQASERIHLREYLAQSIETLLQKAVAQKATVRPLFEKKSQPAAAAASVPTR